MAQTLETPLGIVTLRLSLESDLMDFRELRLEALRNNPASFGSDYDTVKANPLQFWISRLYAGSEDGALYFAVHGEDLIGMCGIQLGTSPKTRHGATIWGVYVRQQWQGLHIARNLLENCIDWGKQHRVKVAKLAVVADNASAIRCYEGCGFTVYGRDPMAICHAGFFYDELLMVRPRD
jgi:ribosomal protein S18 acetylase RimI-like enzyme